MDEEEWFFNSFKRYNELQMFDFPRNIAEIDLTSTNNLCVALEEDLSHKNEILIFQLPTALQPKSNSAFTKLERHLSFDHGYFTESPLVQMKCTASKDNLIISERNGVALFDLTSEDSDIIRKVSSIPGDVECALIATNPAKPYVLLCDGKIGHRSVVDYDRMDVVLHLEDSIREPTIPMFSSIDIVSFGITNSGSVVSYDMRDGKQTNKIDLKDRIPSSPSNKQCIFKSTFECCSESVNTNLLYVLAGDLLLLDWRNTSEPAQCATLPVASRTGDHFNRQMAVCPSNPYHFALSGFDKNIHICQLKDNQVIPVFTHDGHAYCHDEFEPSVRSCSAQWLPFISSNTLVSSADNASLQCWQFKIP